MSTQKPAVIVVGHGSLLTASGAAMIRIATRLREQGVAPLVEAGFLNYSRPTFAEAVTKCQAQGATKVIVQPYFLIQGHYAANDLPLLVRTVTTANPAVSFSIAGVFGAHPALVQLACKRLAAVDPAPHQNTGLLFVAHGTPLVEANASIHRVLELVQQTAGYGPALTGYLDCNQPDIPSAFTQLAATGVQRIAVLPYFLHLGRHVRQDLPAHFEQARHQHPGIDIQVAQHLEYDPLLVDVAAERIRETMIREDVVRSA
jgi:sirohydrochlorin ferrochelatase